MFNISSHLPIQQPIFFGSLQLKEVKVCSLPCRIQLAHYMWFFITEGHHSCAPPFQPCMHTSHVPCPLHVLLAVPLTLCICHPAVALACCMHNLTVPSSLHEPHHVHPTATHATSLCLHHRTCHIAVHPIVACTTSLCPLQPRTPPTSP